MIDSDSVKIQDVMTAYDRWEQYHDKQDKLTDFTDFLDFIDPVRQSAVRDIDECDYLGSYMVSKQLSDRIRMMCGSHWWAFLKANEDRIERAHTSWSKTRPA